MRGFPKRIKRLIRYWMEEAYERELHRELAKLDESFAEWRRGNIVSGDLSHRIHEWDAGPSRALFKQYNNNPHDISVAYAIVIGILEEDEIPEELLEAISGAINFYRSLQEHGQLRERERTWWQS